MARPPTVPNSWTSRAELIEPPKARMSRRSSGLRFLVLPLPPVTHRLDLVSLEGASRPHGSRRAALPRSSP